MSYKTERAARAAAERAALKMRYPNRWERRVWENIGWYASIRRGGLEIMVYSSRSPGGGGYHAALTTDLKFAGCDEHFWPHVPSLAHAKKHPQLAMDCKLEQAALHLEKVVGAMEEAGGAARGWLMHCTDDRRTEWQEGVWLTRGGAVLAAERMGKEAADKTLSGRDRSGAEEKWEGDRYELHGAVSGFCFSAELQEVELHR